MEYGEKFYTPEFKLADTGPGEISGYASTYNWDSVKERVVPGAFSNLDEFKRDGFVAVGHSWEQLGVASPIEAFEDDNGLFVRAMFHTTPEAQAVRTTVKERLERGNSVKLSIGYEVLADEYVPEGRLLKSLKLYEYSIVTVPAQPRAAVTSAKRLTLPDHSDAVLAAVDELKTRLVSLRDLRMKEGRVLSDANRKRISSLKDALTAVLTDLDELLTATQPNTEKAKAVLLEALRLQAQINGVSTS